MAITNAQQAKQIIQKNKKIKGQDHMLAYITPNEADKLTMLGGQETMTPEGILAYPEFDNYSGADTPGGAMSRSDFESGAYGGTGNAGDGVIDQYQGGPPKVVTPPKKPPITKDNYKKPNRFTTPTAAVLGYIGNQFKNSKLGQALNTKARTDYLENLKESDPDAYAETVGDLSKLGYATKDVEIYGPEGKRDGPMAPGRDIETFTDLHEDQAKAILGKGYTDYLDDRNKTPTGDDGPQDPCKGPNPPAYCFVGIRAAEEPVVEEESPQAIPYRLMNMGGDTEDAPLMAGAPELKLEGDVQPKQENMMMAEADPFLMEEYEKYVFDMEEMGLQPMTFEEFRREAMSGMASGGIAGIRQGYILGGIAKAAKKAVKGVTRAVKKIAKSKIGKAALLAAGGYYLGGGNLFGLQRTGMSGFSFGNLPGATSFSNFFKTKGLPTLAKGQIGVDKFGNAIYNRATGTSLTSLLSGMSTPGKAALGIGALTALPLLGIGTGEEEEGEEDRGPGLDIAGIRRNPYLAMQRSGNPYRLMAEGGNAEPVAKDVMPLLDMGGKEKDYRETGGFVDMGRMEKADDVPARLSKNEFVFTADAVRNAGEGDIDKGAEVMYNMMKNLESGGEVSEDSQGLDGARAMFQTSQKLEGVM